MTLDGLPPKLCPQCGKELYRSLLGRPEASLGTRARLILCLAILVSVAIFWAGAMAARDHVASEVQVKFSAVVIGLLMVGARIGLASPQHLQRFPRQDQLARPSQAQRPHPPCRP